MNDIVKRLGEAKQRIREQMRTCTIREAAQLQHEMDHIDSEIDRFIRGENPLF